MKNKKISVITTTYSESAISNIINNITTQSYKNIEIIIVDSKKIFQENRKYYWIDNIFVNIFKPENVSGYYESLRFGLMQATGDFIVFNTRDCFFDDFNFFKLSVEAFIQKRKVDIVFGNTQIVSMFNFYVKKYKFKDIYTPEEFIAEWEKLRMIFVDYFDLNSFIFKKKILFEAEAFSSNYNDALSLDISTLLKSVLSSRYIYHLNIDASKKLISKLHKKEYNTKDLTQQIINHFAISFDIDLIASSSFSTFFL